MSETYVSKRFRTFRKPIRRKDVYFVGERGPEIFISPNSTVKIIKALKDYKERYE